MHADGETFPLPFFFSIQDICDAEAAFDLGGMRGEVCRIGQRAP